MNLIGEAVTNGARLSSACEELGLSERTYQRWCRSANPCDQRTIIFKSPSNKLTAAERQQVIDTANSKEFCDLPPCQIVPKLADQSIYIASESSFYRILRSENQLAHRGRSKPRKNIKPKELRATGPNQVWCWDISYLATSVRGIFYYLYFVIDIFSRKVVGYAVHDVESSDHASALFKRICASSNIEPNTLCLHSDNGAPMKGSALVSTLQQLGVMRSYSRPSVSNDNPYSESAFKTVKYSATYPDFFETVEAAIEWVTEFVDWYNNKHLHSSIKFTTPGQRHDGEDIQILAHREKVYEIARASSPSRWSGSCRNWKVCDEVVLNPGCGIKMAVNE